MHTMPEIINLETADDIKLFGGKAASLAKLMRGGFNVPSGFVIGTNAKMSPALESEIMKWVEALGLERVAVRSSAVAEDGQKSSWAGQFESFLNINKNELIVKIKECISSANSARALAYSKDMDTLPGKVAVIVQKMVRPDFAGVAFSANPINNSKDEIVIEATKGLGDKLVSGDITPDTYVVKLTNITRSSPDPLLTDKQIGDLSGLVRDIEAFFGFPVDVEWAYAGGKFYVLQSRPITTIA